MSFYKGLGESGLLPPRRESLKSVRPCQGGRDRVQGTNLIPVTFLPQRDSNEGLNAKGSVGTDFLTVQQAPYGKTNGDDSDVRLMMMLTLMTVLRVTRMRKASTSAYGMLTLCLALCSVPDVQQLVKSCNSTRQALFSPFFREGTEGSERFSNLLEVTQQVSGGTESHVQESATPRAPAVRQCLCHVFSPCFPLAHSRSFSPDNGLNPLPKE